MVGIPSSWPLCPVSMLQTQRVILWSCWGTEGANCSLREVGRAEFLRKAFRISSFLSKQRAGPFQGAPPWAAHSKRLSTRNAACFPCDLPLSIWPNCFGLGHPVKGTRDRPRLKSLIPQIGRKGDVTAQSIRRSLGPGSSWSPGAWLGCLGSTMFKASAAASHFLGLRQPFCLLWGWMERAGSATGP